ncbi:hypothetical protein [Niabella beijingensis]|uniref:hypothetical protein n=1 Tax=Niabella beijingensis TaxID=2872700 RepID=UPI001CBC1006|nr:hypothetical protein [Niabella beijingensis]MBZ4191615.1 hypothetical protein [Niabella beijingensis]
MKKNINSKLLFLLFLFFGQCLFISCGSSIRLTASWSDKDSRAIKFSKILVVAIGQDLPKRKLEEDQIKRELWANSIPAMTSLDEFGPDFATQQDSTKMREALLSKQFDGILTVRVLDSQEHDRWVPGNGYYTPVDFYHRFYGYCYRVWESYRDPGYMIINLEVLLESNLYQVSAGTLLWSGQSKAFSRDLTQTMAASYAHYIVKNMLRRGIISI